MYRLIAALLLTTLSNLASAQVNLGLVCSSSSETIPRLLTVDGSTISYFNYGREIWVDLYYAKVGAEEIEAEGHQTRKIFISRIDGSWRSYTDMNFSDINREIIGVCVGRSKGEMNQIAADYLAQLSAKRAF